MSLENLENAADGGEADSSEVFKSPLHARFSELECRWSEMKKGSSIRRIDSSTSVTSCSASVRRANKTHQEGRPLAMRRAISEKFEKAQDSRAHWKAGSALTSSSSQHSRRSMESTCASDSVFERLYSHGRAKVAAARRGGPGLAYSSESSIKGRESESYTTMRLDSDASADPSQKSGEGSTISTLSSTSSARRSLKGRQQTPQPNTRMHSRHISTANSVTSFDRGIVYPTIALEEGRTLTGIHMRSSCSVPNVSSPMEHLLDQSIDEHSMSISSTPSNDDVFNRLYRREKRSRASLLASYRGPSSITSNSKRRIPEQEKDSTPIRKGGQSGWTDQDEALALSMKTHDISQLDESFYSTNSDEKQFECLSDQSLVVEASSAHDEIAEESIVENDEIETDFEDPANRFVDSKTFDEELLSASVFFDAVTDSSMVFPISHTPKTFRDPLAFTPRVFDNSPLEDRVRAIRQCFSAQKIQRGFRMKHLKIHSHAAVMIQKTWRRYLGTRALVDLMIFQGWTKCDILSSVAYNRVLVLKMKLEGLTRVIREVSSAEHVTSLEFEDDRIYVELIREVVVETVFYEAPLMEIAVVRLKSSCRRPNFSKLWSSDMIVFHIVRAALSKAIKRSQLKFLYVCATTIQEWYRKAAARKLLRSAEFLCQVEATSKVLRATCLTPTCRKRNAAIRIQCAWRCHRAQLKTTSLLLTSWWSGCIIENAVVLQNKILQMKINLLAVSKAIGQVDCWWLTKELSIHADFIRVVWQREVGIHYEHRGILELGSCTVQLKCQATRSSIIAAWDERQLAIILIKAALERVLVRDQNAFEPLSALMIQRWWRMAAKQRSFIAVINENRQNIVPTETHSLVLFQKHWRRYIIRYRYCLLRSSCVTLQRLARGFNARSLQSRAATTIQRFWRKSSVRYVGDVIIASVVLIQSMVRAYQSRNKFLVIRHTVSRLQALARRHTKCSKALRKTRATVDIQQFWKRFKDSPAVHRRESIVAVQSFLRSARQRHTFKRYLYAVRKLQTVIRAYQSRNQFLATKRAIVIIQSKARQVICRSKLHCRRAAGIRIKNAWLRHRMIHQSAFSAGATVIQSYVRAYKLRTAFLAQRTSAVTVQRVWRESLVRCVLRFKNLAATRVQKAWYQYCVRLQRQAAFEDYATSIQARFRSYHDRRAFLTFRCNVIVAQRVWRASLVRSRLLLRDEAARRLQKRWHYHHAEKQPRFALRTRVLEGLAMMIQAQFRTRRCRKAFLAHRNSVVVAQRMWRGIHARSCLRQNNAAARRLQETWHHYCMGQQRRFARRQAALERRATIIQANFRCYRDRSVFSERRRCIVIVQCLWRGRSTRSCLQLENVAASILQRRWYHHRFERQRQSSLHQAAIQGRATVIQARFRANQVRKTLFVQQRSAVLLQRAWRNSLARSRLPMQNAAACRLQRTWHHHRSDQQRRFTLRQSVLGGLAMMIQAQFRTRRCRKAFLAQRSSIIVAQRVWRGFHVRSCIHEKDAAARRLQKAWHDYCMDQQWRLAMRQAAFERRATMIQANFRCYRDKRVFSERRRCIVVVQRVWRGCSTRSCLRAKKVAARRMQKAWHQHRFERQRQSALQQAVLQYWAAVIQARVRAHQLRKTFLVQRSSAAVLQLVWRSSLARRRWRIQNAAARKLQRIWHHHHEAQQLRFALRQAMLECRAILIQAQLRRHQKMTVFLAQRSNVVVAQRIWRGRLVRKSLLLQNEAACRLQKAWCCHYAMRQRQYALVQTAHAIVIQTQFRAYRRRRSFLTQRATVVAIQRLCRGSLVRSSICVQNATAKVLQKAWRHHCLNRNQQREHQKAALEFQATLIQAQYRCHRRQREFLEQCSSIAVVQRAWRESLTRSQLRVQNGAAMSIQCYWRRHTCESRFCHLRLAVLKIQCWLRKIRSSWKVVLGIRRLQALSRGARSRRMMMRVTLSASIIQSRWRCRCARTYLKRTVYLITRVQAVSRAWLTRMFQARCSVSAIRIQAFFRAILVQDAIARLASNAMCIENAWRSYFARSRFLEKRAAAILYQRWKRMSLNRKRFLSQLQSALVIQYHWRRQCRLRALVLRGVCSMQAVIRGGFTRARLENAHYLRESCRAAISIQRTIRGKVARSKFAIRHEAAISIRKWLRMHLAQKLAAFNTRRYHVGWLVARQKRAALSIQRAYFIWKMQETLLEVQSSVVLLKRSIRGQLERSASRFALSNINYSRRSFERLSLMSFDFDSSTLAAWTNAESMAVNFAAVVIQGAIRRFVAIVRTREMIKKSHGANADFKIGARWRIILLRQDERATTIQTGFRAFQKRRELNSAATRIQATYRCHCSRRIYNANRICIIKLQSTARMSTCRKIAPAVPVNVGGEVVVKKHAALIQALVRGYQSRSYHRLVRGAVCCLQSFWRQCANRIHKQKMSLAAIEIQNWIRAVQAGLKKRQFLAVATKQGVHDVEEAILCEMERNARHQVVLLLLKPRRARTATACVRRLARRVKSLSQDCEDNNLRRKSYNTALSR